MSSCDSDSSDEIDNGQRKKQSGDDKKQIDDAEIKEEYQDIGDEDEEQEEELDDNQESINSQKKGLNDKKNQKIGVDCQSNSNGPSHKVDQNVGGQKKAIEIKQSYSFHNNNPNHIITNELNDVEWECFDCNKKYKSYPAFYTHNKIKHNGNPPEKYKIPRPLDSISKDRGRPKADTSTKQKFTDKDQRQHNLEDEIYEFLAKTGANEDQDNKIIRQYLNEPVNYFEAMPIFCQYDPSIQENIHQIQQEIKKVVELVKQYDDYQYIDPMELSDPADHEINLFNLKYLIQYYKQHNLITEYSLIGIFIAWIGKEMRQDSYQELCVISIAYFTCYTNEMKKHSKVQPNTRKEILEKIHKDMEYTNYLSGYQFKLFMNQQCMYDLVCQVKLWMIFWTETVYNDGFKNQANTFHQKQEAPIVLGSDDDEDDNENDGVIADDKNEGEDASNKIDNSQNINQVQVQQIVENVNNEDINIENLNENEDNNQLENPEQHQKGDSNQQQGEEVDQNSKKDERQLENNGNHIQQQKVQIEDEDNNENSLIA